MRLSAYFLPTLRENPKEAQIVSHRLMLRAGMIQQSSAGIYSWLPLGYKVLRKIEQIVREEQDAAGAQEVLMPTIQSADLWQESGRYEDYGKEMLRIEDRHGRNMLYGPTNEELITDIFRSHVRTYKALPLMLYHIQWKFRDEVRPRFGVMRGREFLMKDNYSFDVTYENAVDSYNKMFVAYLRTYARMGLSAIPMKADTGPIGGDLSHEFIVLADTGESAVFYDQAWETQDFANMKVNYADMDEVNAIVERYTSIYAATEEKHIPGEAPVPEANLKERRGIEVGQIFYFGTKYSEPLGAVVSTPEGEDVPVHMGSYGVGVSRLAGAIIEASHDDRGIIWPEQVAPFSVAIANLKTDDKGCTGVCEDLYTKLSAGGVDVLIDDRDERPGAKMANLDLIGVPWQVLVGPRGLKSGMVEVKNRKSGAVEEMTPEAALNRFAS